MLIYGKQVIFEYLNNCPETINQILTSDKNLYNNITKKYKNIILCNKKKLDSKVKINHQNIIAEIKEETNIVLLDNLINDSFKETKYPTIIILDHITSPYNLGAIIRTAVYFGITHMIISKDRQVQVNPTVIKCSAGLTSRMKYSYVTNIRNTLKYLKKNKFWIISTTVSNGNKIESVRKDIPKAIIMGDEHKGVHKLVQKESDYLVSIENKNNVDSLNVSVAAAIIFYELNKNAI